MDKCSVPIPLNSFCLFLVTMVINSGLHGVDDFFIPVSYTHLVVLFSRDSVVFIVFFTWCKICSNSLASEICTCRDELKTYSWAVSLAVSNLQGFQTTGLHSENQGYDF